MGKPIFQAQIEVDIVASIYRYYADNGPSFLEDEELEVAAGGKAIVRKDGLGVLLGIMPWNFPYYQVARFAAPNLMNGNTILLKHAPQCPESALAMEQIFRDAGAPEGAYVNVFATNEQVADIIADPRVAGCFTDGFRARRIRRCRDRRPQPQEGRAGTRRLRSVPGARLRQHVTRPPTQAHVRPLRQRRPGLQRRQTHHRR